ncbi:hypothetical protein OKW44_002332 [Paraburkholderia sp. WSM4174]
MTDALTMAWFRRRPAPGVLLDTWKGIRASQYASAEYEAVLALIASSAA